MNSSYCANGSGRDRTRRSGRDPTRCGGWPTCLHELGYRDLQARGLGGRHAVALAGHWDERGLSVGTKKNLAAHLRWWARHVDRPWVVPRSNAQLGIGNRRYVTNEDKTRVLDERLDRVTDPHARMSLRLQEAFGLRREEAIKFNPAYADRGNRLVLKASWCKGGRPREIPIRAAQQRRTLDAAHRLAGNGSLIPPQRKFHEQRDVYVKQVTRAGFDRMHGLRHAYAQRRYQELAGWPCPIAGGPPRKSIRGGRREADRKARQTIAREMGHGRIEVVARYLGN